MRKGNWMLYVVVLVFIGAACNVGYDIYDSSSRGCTPSGEQRFVNSMIHAGDGAISTLVIEDKLVCKDGSLKWRVRYN